MKQSKPWTFLPWMSLPSISSAEMCEQSDETSLKAIVQSRVALEAAAFRVSAEAAQGSDVHPNNSNIQITIVVVTARDLRGHVIRKAHRNSTHLIKSLCFLQQAKHVKDIRLNNSSRKSAFVTSRFGFLLLLSKNKARIQGFRLGTRLLLNAAVRSTSPGSLHVAQARAKD